MVIKKINPREDARWDLFVNSHPYGTIYHHSAWQEVIEQTYHHTPSYWVLEDENHSIRGGIAFFLIRSPLTGNRAVSLPYSDSGDPLVDTVHDLRVLFRTLREEMDENLSYFEIRTFRGSAMLDNRLFQKKDYYKSFLLDLNNSTEDLWKGFHPKAVRYAIRKAERSGIRIREGKDERDMQTFYRLHVKTRRRHGVPPQPYAFFQNIWKILVSKGLAFLLLAEVKGKEIAGSLFLHHNKTLYHKFNSSDPEFLHYQPNHLLLWTAIQRGCQEGFQWLDFGRTSPDNQGLMEFKRRWGTREMAMPYFYFPEVRGITSTEERSFKYRLMTTFWRKAPLALNKWGGKILYRHLG
ncbi:GNAT family N-acetyltransferase [candidate division TA06 bacterium]|nr:GNAT family N-acetyltransferase [candidate division TA06 bacterium]